MRALLILALCGCSLDPAPRAEERPPPAVAPPAPLPLVRHSIAVDDEHACAIEATGKLACWGRGSNGRLGTSDGADHATPIELPDLTDLAGVVAGATMTCGWTTHGEVSCWGHALGPTPKRIAGLADITQVTVGSHSACGLHATGRVSCWNDDGKGLRPIPTLTDAVEIAGAYGGGAEQLCARTKSGDVTCGNQVEAFAAIPELAGATELAGAGCRFVVLLPGHRLARWVGYTGRPMPEYIRGVTGEHVVIGGHLNDSSRFCVLGAHAQCWGWSDEPLTLSDAPAPPAGARDLALDTEAACARVADRIACWGRVGRLGDGNAEYPDAFVPVVTDARQLDAMGRTMCVVRATGRVACWGAPLSGDTAVESEPGREIDREIVRAPVELPGVTDAVELAIEGSPRDEEQGAFAVCARRADGATCWSIQHGVLAASDAPSLASAVKLYSGPAICGVSARGDVHCVRFGSTRGYIAGFAEGDYDKYIYTLSPSESDEAVRAELERRFRKAFAAKRLAAGYHLATIREQGDVATPNPKLEPGQDMLRPPGGKPSDLGELRRNEWTLHWDPGRARGVHCLRHTTGTVACWGERDYLGAGQRSAQSAPVTVALPR